MSHVITTVIPSVNVGITVAFKFLLMHLRIIKGRGILKYFPEKKVSIGLENKIHTITHNIGTKLLKFSSI
jgi:hypothetical protein